MLEVETQVAVFHGPVMASTYDPRKGNNSADSSSLLFWPCVQSGRWSGSSSSAWPSEWGSRMIESRDGLNLIPRRSKPMANEEDRSLEAITSEQDDRDASLYGYEILTYPADFTLEVLVDKWIKKEIKVPRLQRNFVWNQTQSSKLIESFLMGLPVPPVFFYQDKKDNKLLVIDGQQRLRTIAYFFSGLFGETGSGKKPGSFSLVGLDKKSPYLGSTHQQLKEDNNLAFNKLQNSVLRCFIMKQLDPADDTSIFQVFERLNTGGVILQGQEVRNCIYEGKFNAMLDELNKTPSWRDIFGNKKEDKRMRDIELILRFFSLFHNVKKYEKPMKQFLNTYMKANQNPSDEMTVKLKEEFTDTASLVISYLGKQPFHLRRGLNVAVYDSVFTAFARNVETLKATTITETRIARMRDKFSTLTSDSTYLEMVTSATTDDLVVPKRINKAEEVLFG
jgi:hypothetical protein